MCTLHRDAPADVLEQAVHEACLFSHTHPLGLDGARVAAAAVVWLSKQDSGAGRASPSALLQHLAGVARTEDMQQKLSYLQQELFQVRSYQALLHGSYRAK